MTDRSLSFDTQRRWHAARYLSDLAQRFAHLIAYYLLLNRPGTRLIQIAGFRLTIRPTVYDPRFYRAPAFFADFIGSLDLSGKVVADLFTGSGIQALAAGRAGAAKVFAIDVNPIAAATAGENARQNGFPDQVVVLASNLFSAVAAEPHFDIILANPPFCEGQAWNVADRAWRAGPAYRDIIALFDQAYRTLTPGGVMYMVNSTLADLKFLEELIRQAGFCVKVASRREVFLETMVIYELRPSAFGPQPA